MRRVLLLCALAGASHALAGPPAVLLELQEYDPDGSRLEVQRETGIVDVGSTVRIGTPERRVLLGQVPAGGQAAQVVSEYARLVQAVEELNKGLEPLEQAARSWAQQPQDWQALGKALGQVADPTAAILELVESEGPERDKLNAWLESASSISDQYQVVARWASERLASRQKVLEEATRREGVYFQLGAWMVGPEGSRPLHLDGFDEYSPEARYEFGRWQLALDDKQQAQLESAVQSARTFNEKGALAFMQELAPSALKRLMASAREKVEDVRQRSETLAGSPGVAPPLLEQLRQTQQQLERYLKLLAALEARYSAPAATNSQQAFLLGTQRDLLELQEGAQGLLLQLEKLREALKAPPARGAPSSPGSQGLSEALERLREFLDKGLERGLGALRSAASVAEVSVSTLEFGQQVRKLSLDELPSSVELDLNATGRRAPGDSIVVRLAVGRGEAAPRVLETRRLVMYRVAPYLETVPGLIFASAPALPGEAASFSFQAAPAYSVLLKWGSRDWALYNTLLTPGIGLNLSALDFNRDNTPELGVAPTVSLFRNVIQVGYGYNVFQRRGYFFFGLGLPLPTLGVMPGAATSVP